MVLHTQNIYIVFPKVAANAFIVYDDEGARIVKSFIVASENILYIYLTKPYPCCSFVYGKDVRIPDEVVWHPQTGCAFPGCEIHTSSSTIISGFRGVMCKSPLEDTKRCIYRMMVHCVRRAYCILSSIFGRHFPHARSSFNPPVPPSHTHPRTMDFFE